MQSTCAEREPLTWEEIPDRTEGGAFAEAPARILIVDDNDANRLYLGGILQAAGYETREAAGGDEALELASGQLPDLVLLDVMMPGRSGHEVCAELKASPRTRAVPVVFLSSLSDPEDKIAGLECGAADYVAKPFDPGEVLARVRSQLGIDRLRREVVEANRALTAKQEKIEEALQAAADLQRLLLPTEPPRLESVAVEWRFLPCDLVGGDLFQVQRLDERHLALYVVDVSGHGVPAAMLTVAVARSLAPEAGLVVERVADASHPIRVRSPREVLEGLDREYPIERFERGFTLWYGLLDLDTGELRYARAGHPRPVLSRAGGGHEILDAGGSIIGLGGLLPFGEGRTRLGTADRLFVYSDGLPEQAAPSGERFGEERLAGVVEATRGSALPGACETIVAAWREFGGGCAAEDDLTLLAVEFHPPGVKQSSVPPTRARRAEERMESRTLSLQIESDLEKVFAATETVRGFCSEIGFSDEEAVQVQTCVAEALNNAVLHAYDGQPGRVIDLAVVPQEDRVTIEVRDRGRAMEEGPAEPPEVDAEDWEALASSGRGWWIMRSWMDEVSYQSGGGTNVVRMTRRRRLPAGRAAP